MEDETRSCTGCGKPYLKSELFSMPSGRGAYRREHYYCPICKEAVWKRRFSKTKETISTNPGRPRFTRTGIPFKW